VQQPQFDQGPSKTNSTFKQHPDDGILAFWAPSSRYIKTNKVENMQIINSKSRTAFRGQYRSLFSGYSNETHRTGTDMEGYSQSLCPVLLHQAAHQQKQTIHSTVSVNSTHLVGVGPCHHGMSRPHVAGVGTVSNMEGSCEYIK
jgi:hypothetical protein